MGRADVTARLLSLVLYLCSEVPDITRREVPPAKSSTRQSAAAQTVVMSAGFRHGAALRTSMANHSGTEAKAADIGSRLTFAERTGITTGPAARSEATGI